MIAKVTYKGVDVPQTGGAVMPAPKKSPMRPGDLLAMAIEKATGIKATSRCNCAARQKQMNEWGWLGCWRHRKTIVGWLVDEAKKRKATISDDDLAAIVDQMKREGKKSITLRIKNFPGNGRESIN